MDNTNLVKEIVNKLATERLVRFGYDRTLDDESAAQWIQDDEEVLKTDILHVLEHLEEEDRLLPANGVTRIEYGRDPSSGYVIVGMQVVGTSVRAQKTATHQRTVTVWPEVGVSSQLWARYNTAWVLIDRSGEDDG